MPSGLHVQAVLFHLDHIVGRLLLAKAARGWLSAAIAVRFLSLLDRLVCFGRRNGTNSAHRVALAHIG